jgi:TolA-binding protein
MAKAIGRTLSRIRKVEFGRLNPYPENFEFLAASPFFAITQVRMPESYRTQYRVEFTPQSARKLVTSYELYLSEKKRADSLEDQLEQANSELEELRKQYNQLEAEKANIQRTVDILASGLPDDERKPHSKPQSHLQRIEERAIPLQGPPRQGGLPS